MGLQVRIINNSQHPLPQYATAGSAGMDVIAMLEASVTIMPLQRVLVPTGLHIELPQGYEAQIRPRSGLALKHGLTVLNSPGTIDSDYRGEIKIILINLGNEAFTINDGDRIAQMIIAPYTTITWQAADGLQLSTRGKGGFGHTGITQ
jgi:dUTP pyrophosphatase